MKTILIKDDAILKTSKILDLLKAKFNVWSYYDNNTLDKNFPIPKKSAERYFLESQEPDSDTLGMPVTEANNKYPDKQGITLRERLLLELAYFDKTGKHLDINGVTFCSGSRDVDGDVPFVYWFDSEVRVYGYSLDSLDSDYGVRSAITLNPLELNENTAITLLKDKGYKITRLEEKEY
jgi:hypothetical protein